MTDKMSYASTGVNYDAMDPFKVMCQNAARETADNILRRGVMELPESRGESCYLVEAEDCFLAHVEEGLGTKNLVADAMYGLQQPPRSYYDQIAQDAVAMIVNDIITLGAMPLSVAMHLAVGSSDWFKDERRCQDLARGWKKACDLAGCAWGGGETPTLKGIVNADTLVLSGSAMGIIKHKHKLIECNIEVGDDIVLIESSGIHANGLTLARKIAEKLPDGYLTHVANGLTYGEMLLEPTRIYVPLVEACINAGINIHYAINITGHGWRKLMRAPQPFAYVIDRLPTEPHIFRFIQKHGPVDDEEAYGTFNMGAGFALIVPTKDLQKLWDVIASFMGSERFNAVLAGKVEASTEKKVVIKPKKLEFKGETLAIR